MDHPMQITNHAEARMSQRGFKFDEVDLIRFIGTEVRDGYLVRRKDFELFDQALRKLRSNAQKVVGKRIVVDGDKLITAYHASSVTQRRLLKKHGF